MNDIADKNSYYHGYVQALDDVVSQLELVEGSMFPGEMPPEAVEEIKAKPEKAIRGAVHLTVDNVYGRIANLLIDKLAEIKALEKA